MFGVCIYSVGFVPGALNMCDVWVEIVFALVVQTRFSNPDY